MATPRPEYPRPQFERKSWLNLNGEWEFQVDNEKSGEYKKFFEKEHLTDKIIVPFCPESELSGIGNKDFMNCVWYKKSVELSDEQANACTVINFGAVDYYAVVYVNSKKAGEHKGGYCSFSMDISKFVKAGENDITVCAYDDTRSQNQPTGKQSEKYESYGCLYTRTTGIWQTVWLEFTDFAHIKNVNYTSDISNLTVNITAILTPDAIGCKLNAKALWQGKEVGKTSLDVTSTTESFGINLSELHIWDLGEGNLYDIEYELIKSNIVVDKIYSYFGMRSVGLDKKAFLLNGRKVFGRWVLDQGFYPDGIYTAPTDEALKNDIMTSMELGFNGARLHQKVFEPRFLYWADKLGYMVWGEYGNWGHNITQMGQIEFFISEWMEVLDRDMMHPSIIGWIPFNETWDWHDIVPQSDSLVRIVYETTKAIDKTRPVIDASGNFHVVTDIFDVHDYEQDVEKFKSFYEKISEGVVNDQIARNPKLEKRQHYNGEPVYVSEYGGIKWAKTTDENSWGYGNGPKTEEEFIERYRGLTESLLDNPEIMGFCYTQLYDVEQEQNGLMTYEREYKFKPEIIKAINTKKAAIED